MDHNTVSVRVALNAWQTNVDRCTKLINGLSDDQLLKEIAPGKTGAFTLSVIWPRFMMYFLKY